MVTKYGTLGNDSSALTGTSGDDFLYGFPEIHNYNDEDGDDTINGLGGNDTIEGGTGHDNINGGTGNDTLKAGPNLNYLGGNLITPSDFIDGGADIDTVIIDYANVVDASYMPVAISCHFAATGEAQVVINTLYNGEHIINVEKAKIYSGSADDNITSTNGDDFINVGYGSDTVNAAKGNDTVVDYGSAFDLNGGDGTDTLNWWIGSGGGAIVFDCNTGILKVNGVQTGTALNFEVFDLSGSANADTFTGNNSDNDFSGGGGADTITGGTGKDTITGDAGNDILNGGNGDDTIYGGYDKDTVSGAGGNDTIGVNMFDDYVAGEIYDGGAGLDTLALDFNSLNAFDLTTATFTGFETAKLSGYLYAWDYTVTMSVAQIAQFTTVNFGQTSTNRMTLKLKDKAALNFSGEVINFYKMQLADGGQAVNFAGASFGTESTNNETVIGGTGNDTITGYDVTGKFFYAQGGLGNDTLIGKRSTVTFDGGAGNDTLKGGTSLNDTVSFKSATSAVVVDLRAVAQQNTVGAGLDTISGFENVTGSSFNDTLTGTAGINTVSGGVGNDVLQGLGGADKLYGSDGLDTASYALSAAGVTVTLGATGNFTVATGGDALGDTALGIERLTGSAFVDKLTGNASGNVLTGLAGNDTLSGLGGNDILVGGAGRDTLTGGANNDVFDFNAITESGITNTTWDIITDFVKNQDKIDLSTIDANTATAAVNEAFALLAKGTATSAVGTGKIGWYWEDNAGTANDKTFLRINNDADPAIEMVIQINGLVTFSATPGADFIF